MMHKDPDSLPLPQVLQALRKHGIMLSYSQVWLRIQDGTIPASRGADGRRWIVFEADLPLITRRLERFRQPCSAA